MDLEFTSDEVEESNPLEGLAFTLDGERFECEGRLSILDISNLARHAIIGSTKEAAQAAAVTETLRQALGEPVFERFTLHVREHNTPDETVLKIIQAMNEAIQARTEEIAERPTGPASRSSAGQKAPADRASRVVSLQGGDVQLTGGRRSTGRRTG